MAAFTGKLGLQFVYPLGEPIHGEPARGAGRFSSPARVRAHLGQRQRALPQSGGGAFRHRGAGPYRHRHRDPGSVSSPSHRGGGFAGDLVRADRREGDRFRARPRRSGANAAERRGAPAHLAGAGAGRIHHPGACRRACPVWRLSGALRILPSESRGQVRVGVQAEVPRGDLFRGQRPPVAAHGRSGHGRAHQLRGPSSPCCGRAG